MRALIPILVLTLVFSGCSGTEALKEVPTYTPPPTYTPQPTYTPLPTYTPIPPPDTPTAVPPTDTPIPPPSPTAIPTATPVPSEPTNTPTPAPSLASGSVFFRTYSSLGDNPTYNTGVSANDYLCGVVGMAALGGDINEGGEGGILKAYMFTDAGMWWIRADFHTHGKDEDWTVHTMCIARSQAAAFQYYEFSNLGDNVDADTGIPAHDYLCGVIGMAALGGDINEKHGGDILRAYTYTQSGTWWLRGDFRTHNRHESWNLNLLCLRRTHLQGFRYQEYRDLGDDVQYNTGTSALEYRCGIVGIEALDGDINENDPGDILRTFTYTEGGTWWIRADFRTHTDHENWNVNVLCVSAEIAESR